MSTKRPLLLLFDGHAMVFRAWFSIPERLASSTGQDTRGVYGFVNTLIKVINDQDPTHAAVAFDTRAPTFRDEMYAEYKAQRPPIPDDLHAQIPMVKDVMRAFQIPVFELDGYEADDLIGTISRQAAAQEMDTLIVTGDADQLQLVAPDVQLLMYTGFANTKVYDVEAVKARYGGLGPESIPDIKGLMGDPSDNIPGVPGVGEKATIAILQGRGHLETVYEDLDAVEQSGIRGAKRIRKLLEDHREAAFAGRDLTTIRCDAPIEFEPGGAEFWRYDRDEVVSALLSLEFNSVIPRIPHPDHDGSASAAQPGTQLQLGGDDADETTPASSGPHGDYQVVSDGRALEALAKQLHAPAGFAFDTETSSTHPIDADLVGISLSSDEGRGWYVPVGHREGEQLSIDQVRTILGPLFADPEAPKIAHNANFDLTVLEEAGFTVAGLAYDTMIAAALCGKRNLGLKQLALEQFRVEMTPISELIGTGRKQISMAEVPVEKAAPYAAADADFTWRLKSRLDPVLDTEQVRPVFEEIEIPLIPVIVGMQRTGVLVETDVLQEMSNELGARLAQLITETRELLGGREINLNSTQQLAGVLFDEMGTPKTRRTKTGYTLDANTLESLQDREDLNPSAYELIGHVLHYRELSKLKSTYVDALPGLVNQATGRVHTSFNQVGSATGRLSSADPNVQNIPVRTELGRRVRKAFTTLVKDGWLLLGADYSQIELRILAHLSREPALIEAFRNGEDIHSATAATMYELASPGQVTADQRRIAKILNFGVIYGLGPVGVARQTDLTRQQGQQFIDMYFHKYPGIRDYIEKVKFEAKQKGYVQTITGRRRRLPEINSGNQGSRAAAERMAVNMPIQGTSADIIKLAMIHIDAEIDRRGLQSNMLIQVHDELIFEVPPSEFQEMVALVKDFMPHAMDLSVPLDVEVKSGPTWGDME